MASPISHQTDVKVTVTSKDRSTLSKPHQDGSGRIDTEQMFQLIDKILPFEACLYHQVLPLSIEGSRLNLGMVNPEDTAALDYVRRMLAYINTSLDPRLISSEVHQSMLSAYLNQSRQKQQQSADSTPASPQTADTPPPQPTPDPSEANATLIIDSPEQLTDPLNPPELKNSRETSSQPAGSENRDRDIAPPPPMPPAFTGQALPTLTINAQYLLSPIDVLATLPPDRLLQELLGRVLVGGIGRLFFERQPEQGRVLWSQNGVLQSVLEGLSPSIFQGVINELKKLTSLPLIPVQKPTQVEIERLHEHTRLLLRFRVMPGNHGEEATLQVLRGAALKFHQQQQLTSLSRDALSIAQQLQRKLSEIRDYSTLDSSASGTHLETLSALTQLLQSIEQQIRDIGNS